jgi:aminoglycoside phosphotransferase
MEDKDKLLGIEDYLKELLPGCAIEKMWDSESSRHVFRVDAPTGETRHTIGRYPHLS